MIKKIKECKYLFKKIIIKDTTNYTKIKNLIKTNYKKWMAKKCKYIFKKLLTKNI
jgi:uncharacterized HAD superfamily protein